MAQALTVATPVPISPTWSSTFIFPRPVLGTKAGRGRNGEVRCNLKSIQVEMLTQAHPESSGIWSKKGL